MSNTPQPPAPPTRHSKAWRGWFAIAAVFAALAVLFAFGLYRWDWNGATTRIVTNVVPYPAAIVDGSVIRWSDYQAELSAIKHVYAYERDNGLAAPGSIYPTEDVLKQRALDGLIGDRLAASVADAKHVTVSNAEVQDAYDRLAVEGAIKGAPKASRAAAELHVADMLDARYGLSSRAYEDMVLRPLLIRQKLQAMIRQDDSINADKEKKAEAAATALKAGKDFKATALLYSEDPGVNISFGDRGFVGTGLLPPEVDAAVAKAKTGDILGPIKTVLGYSVIKVGEIRTLGKLRQTHLYEITVAPVTIDAWLAAQRTRANVITFVH